MPFQFITPWLLPALEALPGEHVCQQHTWVLRWTSEGTCPHTWTNGRMLYQQASCFKHLPNFSKSKVQQSHYFLIYPKINRMIKVWYSIDLCIPLIFDKTEIMLKHLRNGTCISLSIEYQFSFFKNQLYLYIHVKFIFDIHFFEFIVYSIFWKQPNFLF